MQDVQTEVKVAVRELRSTEEHLKVVKNPKLRKIVKRIIGGETVESLSEEEIEEAKNLARYFIKKWSRMRGDFKILVEDLIHDLRLIFHIDD